MNSWVREHVIPALAHRPIDADCARTMRARFWRWLMENRFNVIVVIDCGWPVETGLLSACVSDDESRAMKGPYRRPEGATLLLAAGLDPLLDDTDQRPGAKFTNLDLVGIPWQLIVGPKGVAEGVVEIKRRATGERQTLPLEAALKAIAG